MPSPNSVSKKAAVICRARISRSSSHCAAPVLACCTMAAVRLWCRASLVLFFISGAGCRPTGVRIRVRPLRQNRFPRRSMSVANQSNRANTATAAQLCKSSRSSVSIVFPSHKKGRNTTFRLKYSFNGNKNVAAGRSSRVEKDGLAGTLRLSFVFHRR